MNLAFVIFVALIPLTLGGGLLSARSTAWEILRIARAPSASINGLPAAGHVELVGKADQNATTSRLLHAACVFWEVQVQEARSSRSGV
jgi:hypothetical protein